MNILLSPHILIILSAIMNICILIILLIKPSRGMKISFIASTIFMCLYIFIALDETSAEESRILARQVFVFILSMLDMFLLTKIYRILRKDE